MRKTPKGVTINGVPLESYLEEVCSKKIEREVMSIVRESKNKNIFYHAPRTRCKKPKHNYERNGPVTNIPNIEIHRKNRESYIKQMMQSDNIRGAIVGILLSTDEPVTASKIKDIINEQVPSEPVKSAQIRVHLGYIMKSYLHSAIMKEFTEGKGRGATYCMKDMDRESYNLEGAAFHATEMVNKKKASKAEKDAPIDEDMKDNPNPNIDFVLTDKNNLPVLEVSGRIDVHFHFHIS